MALRGRVVHWAQFCGCKGWMEVDTERHRMLIRPCSVVHIHYCGIVAQDALNRKLMELSSPWKKNIAAMQEMVRVWKPEFPFFRPAFRYAANGLKAYQCFWDNESKGVSLPDELEEPELLADLVQAKACREFQIEQWLETYAKKDTYVIWPEEYLVEPGISEKMFKTLFGREAEQDILRSVREAHEQFSTDGVAGHRHTTSSI